MSTRTREEEAVYRRELRRRKAAEKMRESAPAALSLVPADSPRDACVVDEVRAEIESMGPGAAKLRGQTAMCMRLASVLDTQDAAGQWPQTVAQLRSTLLSMWAEAKASPTGKSRLATMREARAVRGA